MDKIEKIRQEIDRRYNEYSVKKKTDDFIYYSGMADALDLFEQFLDTLSEEPDKSLEEEAEEWAENEAYGKSDAEFEMAYKGFIAGAKWQAEQDDRDAIFWKGMQHSIKGMKEDAVNGIYTKSMDGKNVFVESGALKIDPESVKVGDPVKLIIIKDNESD